MKYMDKCKKCDLYLKKLLGVCPYATYHTKRVPRLKAELLK